MDLNDPESWRWIWLIVAGVLAVAELAVPGSFFMLSFAVGALVATVVAFAGGSILAGWIAFVAGSVVALAVLIPIGRRLNRTEGDESVGAMRLHGHVGVVLETIPSGPQATGMVRIEREEWRAENESGDEVPVGTKVRVIRVHGTRVVVTPFEEPDVAVPMNDGGA